MRYRSGQLVGVLGISRDTTVLHEAEEELRRRLALQERLEIIAETAPGMLFEYQVRPDGTCCFPYASPSVREIWGFDPEEVKADGSRVWALVEDRERVKRSMREPERWGEPVVNEYQLLSPKGELWIKSSAVPMRCEDGGTSWYGFLSDITPYKQAEQVLRESEKNLKRAVAKRTNDLRRLAERIETVAEHERATIAQEIHDDLGQLLAAIKIDLVWFKKRAPQDEPKYAEKLCAMDDLLTHTIECARRLTRDLRPRILDELGLVAAIESQLQSFREREVGCHIVVPRRDIEVDLERSSSLFRIFQESMTNVLRHSEASRVDILLDISEEKVTLQITDDGRGITPAEFGNQRSLGLLGMRERALRWGGDVVVTGAPGQGTVVRAIIPRERRGHDKSSDDRRSQDIA